MWMRNARSSLPRTFACFASHGTWHGPSAVTVDYDAVTCRVVFAPRIVHRDRVIVITRFKLEQPLCRQALTLRGEDGRTDYVYYRSITSDRGLLPALEVAGFTIDWDGPTRLWPTVFPR